jgi:hypothetical protein
MPIIRGWPGTQPKTLKSGKIKPPQSITERVGAADWIGL